MAVRIGLAVAVLGSLLGRAQAQQLDNYLPTDLAGYDVMPGVTVSSRARPEFEPLGIRLGEFMVQPKASQAIGFDDNVVGTSQKRGSVVLNTQASVKGALETPRSNLVLSTDVEHYGFLDLPSQSYTNWSVGGGWSHQIGRDTVGFGYRHFGLNQIPTGIDSIGLVRPLPYHTDTGRLSYSAVEGSWTVVPLLDFSAIRFESGAANGAVAQPVGLDRNVEAASVTTFYEFAPQRRAVVVLRGTTAQYLAGNPRPNYDDISVLGGLDYNTTGPWRFRALAGYEMRTYRNSEFRNHAAPVAEATAIWMPTGLTTVTATVVRRIEDANESIQTGYTYTLGRVVVDHEYRRNILLQGRAWVENADYLQGGDQQTLYGLGGSITYLLNRNLRLTASYDFTSFRQNTRFSTNFTRNVALLQLRLAI